MNHKLSSAWKIVEAGGAGNSDVTRPVKQGVRQNSSDEVLGLVFRGVYA
jgi:hypothetical protein